MTIYVNLKKKFAKLPTLIIEIFPLKEMELKLPAHNHSRFQIHRLLAKHFGSFLESKTFNNLDDKIAGNVGKSYIQIRMRTKGAKSPCQQKSTHDHRY